MAGCQRDNQSIINHILFANMKNLVQPLLEKYHSNTMVLMAWYFVPWYFGAVYFTMEIGRAHV